MSSLRGELELKTEQEAFEGFEENGKWFWSSLDDSQVRQEFNKIRCHNHLLNKFSFVDYNPQVRNDIKLLSHGNIAVPLYPHGSPSSDRDLCPKGS